MMKTNRALWTLLAAAAVGLASAGARAQSPSEEPAAVSQSGAAPPQAPGPDQKTNPVEGVTVNAPRPGSGPAPIPDDKAAAYDAEQAKNKAWRDYRESTPPLTPNLNDLSKDFPGLQSYVPKP